MRVPDLEELIAAAEEEAARAERAEEDAHQEWQRLRRRIIEGEARSLQVGPSPLSAPQVRTRQASSTINVTGRMS